MSYDFYYWDGIPGRGEFARLVLEAAGAHYREMERLPEEQGGGMAAMSAFLHGKRGAFVPFAPPFLVDGEIVISQAGAIAAYVGERHGLAPEGEADRHFARSVALTTADAVTEAHDVHHPVGMGLYYEDQTPEAKRRAKEFRAERMPKFLAWYETLMALNPSASGFLVGERLTYADLGLFQLVEGLRYAFPERMAAIEGECPRVKSLIGTVRSHDRVAAYLDSERRLAFNENGIFRHYPALDGRE